MRCAQCQFDNPAGMKFCGECGGKLASICSQCGTESPPGMKFCGECGNPLGAKPAAPASPPAASPPAPEPAAPAPSPANSAPAARSYTPSHLAEKILQSKGAIEGERKQVTVLFCDLVGSTALADRLGPETMHLLLNRFFELALGEIHRFEGTINQFLGDGFMALFGAPIAHEDHARRAVFAALGLQKQIREQHAILAQRHDVEVTVRMGINTGWVVVGGIGDHLRMDYTAVGDTTNLAARLQGIAQPGTILVSETTGRLVQAEVQLQELEPTLVKGKADPILPFQVLARKSSLFEASPGGFGPLSPLVGRQRELAVLEELREQAATGEGQVVGIAGEAGSGKSRLLFEFHRRSEARVAAWYTGRCLSYGTGNPYMPILHLLRAAWGLAENDSPAAVAAKVREHLGPLPQGGEEILPYLLRLLGIEEGTESLAELSAQALQTRTFAALRQVLSQGGSGGLVIVEIEDLHWIDTTSEDFLSYLVEGLNNAPILLVLTYRAGYQPRWIEKSYATQLTMRRLTAQDSRALMEAMIRRTQFSTELADEVLEKAEGNPFFLEELTRSLLERRNQPDSVVPDTIQGVLMARIDRLPEENKRLLQTASVLGREFSSSLLEAIWEIPGSTGKLLGDLKRWEFVYDAAGKENLLYFFKHALTQEAVYQTLLTSRRQALHRAAAQSLERMHANRLEEVYDQLVYHYPLANEAEKAVTYLILFADRAAGGYAHAEAAKALREALQQAERLGEAERPRTRVELILRLAASLLPLAQIPETLELFLRHRESVDQLGDDRLSGPYFFWLAHTYSYLGQQQEAADNARKAIEHARRAGDPATEGKACYVLSRDAFWSGQFSQGIGHGLQAIELLETSQERWWQGQAYWVAGFHHYVLGQFEPALRAMAEAEAIWQALADPRLDPSWSTGYFYASLGDWEKGIAECRGGVARAQDPLNTGVATGFLGYAYLEKGDFPQAVESLSDAVRQMKKAGMPQLLGWFSAFLADALLATGRNEEARELALQAVSVTEEVRFGYGSGLAQRSVGRVLTRLGSYAEAAERLHKALGIFRSLQVPFEAGRTRMELALLARAAGREDESAAALAEAREVFAALGVPRYLEKVAKLARAKRAERSAESQEAGEPGLAGLVASGEANQPAQPG